MPPADPCRLYLISPPAFEPAIFAELLAAALDAGDIACVRLELETDDDDVRRASEHLVPVCRAREAAFFACRASPSGSRDGRRRHPCRWSGRWREGSFTTRRHPGRRLRPLTPRRTGRGRIGGRLRELRAHRPGSTGDRRMVEPNGGGALRRRRHRRSRGGGPRGRCRDRLSGPRRGDLERCPRPGPCGCGLRRCRCQKPGPLIRSATAQLLKKRRSSDEDRR